MITQLLTYRQLGYINVARVVAYRLGLKTGSHPVLRLTAPVAAGPFLRPSERTGNTPAANDMWDTALWWFGRHQRPLPDGPPDWFANPFSNTAPSDASRDWWQISDFGQGDIKGIWELSRLDWLVAAATKAAKGNSEAVERLNGWLDDWAQKNPPYKGPNWKCGQEASIRVMHLVTAAWILGQDRTPEAGLVTLLRVHLQRIAPTMSYAIGQQNNHGTSEAAALFIGGSFLMGRDPRAATWARKGRRWLEERAAALIETDGSFSQYSINYHRVMLDTYALAEAWRQHRGLNAFSDRLRKRLAAATEWLRNLVDAETGDAPNIGANDGARLLQLTGTDYRDFRPSVQLAAALFCGADAFGPGPWTAPLRWLEVPDGQPIEPTGSISFDDGGYHVLRRDRTMAVLRYPRFRFRPSQADALHLDLWHRGRNLLRDGGTFSYNADGADWFGSTAAHNTVVFDGRDQMPRLGRFLFGNWLQAEGVQTVEGDQESIAAAAGYTDAAGARHHRQVVLNKDSLTCIDTLSGPFRHAELRWRLCPADWILKGATLTGAGIQLAVQVEGQALAPTLGIAPESRYYLERTEVPLLSIPLHKPSRVITTIGF